MDKRIFLCDMYVLDSLVKDELKTDAMSMIQSPNGQARLKVKIDATHAGVITNLRVYPAIRVQDGYKTFYSKENGGDAEYGAPILRHHNSGVDSIGRVVSAGFTQLKQGEDFYEDYLNPDMPGKRGSGVVTVEGIISDPDAIQKVIDERYLSVSAGHSTNKMTCSVCADSIFACTHTPGKRYDEDQELDPEGPYLCYGITDRMKYHEVSMVNIPAQPPAKIVEFNWEEAKGQDKDQTLSSLTNLKRSAVSSLLLSDEKTELNLLSGKDKNLTGNKIYSIPHNTAEKLKGMFCKSETKSQNDHSDQDESFETENSNETKEVSPVETFKDNEMTDKTITDTVEKSIYNDLQKRFTDLESELTNTKTKVTELEQAVSEKDSQIGNLNTTVDNLQEENKNLLDEMKNNTATLVAGLRVRLAKPDAVGLDSDELKTAYIEKLTKRSLDSLKDSLADLQLELANQKEEVKADDSESVTQLLQGDKVESPVQENGDKPAATKKVSKDGLDLVF